MKIKTIILLSCKKYIKNHYEKYADEINDDVKYGECVNENPIWIYWQQGIENAPELVQKCIKSVVEFSERPVIKLDAKSVENIFNYQMIFVKSTHQEKCLMRHYQT